MATAEANAPVNPGPVGAWERLGRRVFSGNAAKTPVPPHVFLNRGSRDISVDRLTRVPLLDTVIADADAAALQRGANRRFYGWAVVGAEDVIAAGCQVAASPLPNNPYHADIVLPDATVEDADSHRECAVALAGVSDWQPRP